MVIEREHLLPLAAEGADLAQTSFPTVNGLGCVKVLTNTYSVPLPAATQVQAKAYASRIELWHAGRCVARHERCYQRQQQILDLEHYLDVLYRKPGALAGSKPLEQKRQAGLWPVKGAIKHGQNVTIRGGTEDAWLDDPFCTDGCGGGGHELMWIGVSFWP